MLLFALQFYAVVDSWGIFVMKRLQVFALAFLATFALFSTSLAPAALAADCGKNRTFFGIPTWYKYLSFDENCNIVVKTKLDENKNGKIDSNETKASFTDIWLIVIAVIEILLTLAGILAVVFIIISGVKFITSQGEPQKIVEARNALMYAVIGVVITIVATQIVAFIGRSLS